MQRYDSLQCLRTPSASKFLMEFDRKQLEVHLAFRETLSRGPGILVPPTGGRRARKPNVDDPPDLGDCGGELRGAWGELGNWGTRNGVGICS